MKIKCLTFFSLLCSLVFLFASCASSEIEDMGLGNTGGSGDPKIDGIKNTESVCPIYGDTLISPPQSQVHSAGLGNTGGSGDPKKQFFDDAPTESVTGNVFSGYPKSDSIK